MTDTSAPAAQPVRLTTVSVEYSRKLNLGDYESADAKVFLSADVRGSAPEAIHEAMLALWHMANQNVVYQLLPMENLKRKRLAKNGTDAKPVNIDRDRIYLGFSLDDAGIEAASFKVNQVPVNAQGEPTEEESLTLAELMRKHADEYDRFAAAADRFGEERPNILDAFTAWLPWDLALQRIQRDDPARIARLVEEYATETGKAPDDEIGIIHWIIENAKIDPSA